MLQSNNLIPGRVQRNYVFMTVLNDTDKSIQKARQELHKNAISYIEQILEATPHETAAVRSLTANTIHIRWTSQVGYCWRSKDDFISDVLWWILSHGHASVEPATRTYLQQFCINTGCRREDLPRVMDDRDKWRERVREIHATSTTWWWRLYWIDHLFSRDSLFKLCHLTNVAITFLNIPIAECNVVQNLNLQVKINNVQDLLLKVSYIIQKAFNK